jgi:hypothetical protein
MIEQQRLQLQQRMQGLQDYSNCRNTNNSINDRTAAIVNYSRGWKGFNNSSIPGTAETPTTA